MLLELTFKAVPRTYLNEMVRTFNFPVYTNSVVFSDMFDGEQFKAAALPVSARVLLSSGDVFQSQTSCLCKLRSACRTTLDSPSALTADVVAIHTEPYWWHHVLHTQWTLQISQQSIVDST